MSKRATLLLITVLVASSLIMLSSAFAQSPKPSVPEFTLKCVDYSYDVPAKTTSTTDPYTNETITTTVPGRHVENKTIEATINNNIGASYYNFRYKGYYGNEWSYYLFNSDRGYDVFSAPDLSSKYAASTSDYTVISLKFLTTSIPKDGEVDIQVQALIGNYRQVPSGMIGPPFPTYDFYFEGTTSDWSNTQTITIGESQTPTPPPTSTPYQEPQQTAQEVIIGTVIAVAVIIAGLGLLIYLIKRK